MKLDLPLPGGANRHRQPPPFSNIVSNGLGNSLSILGKSSTFLTPYIL